MHDLSFQEEIRRGERVGEGEEEIQSNNIIAINYSNNQLGLAGYDESQNTIYGEVFEVSLDDCEGTLSSIKSFFNPSLFLVHPSILANTSLLKFILQGVDGTPDFYSYKTLRTSAWNEKTTTNILYNDLKIRTIIGEEGRIIHESAFETIRRLQIDLDLERIRLTQVLGALLTYLQDVIFKLDKGKILISSIKEFPIVSYMRIDKNSFHALQIFSEDFHPNWISGKGRSKEGFSLFGLFDRTHSILGRKRLREWMLKPYSDVNKILQRQNCISFILDDINKDVLSQCTFNLKNIYDIPRIIIRIKKVEANYSDWCKLYFSITNSISILDKFEAHKSFSQLEPDSIQFIDQLSSNLNVYVIRNLAKLLSSVIDFPSTLEAKRIQIQEGFDQVLDKKREIYGSIESLLFEAGQKVIDTYSFLEKVSVVFIDQVGYLLALSKTDSAQLSRHNLTQNPPHGLREQSSIYNQEEMFTWIFNQEETSYFKNDIMREMDNSIGDIKSDILDRENLILINLEDQLLEFEYDLLQLGVSMSNLDAYMSLGEIAFQFKLVKPEIVLDHSIVIKNGRHLLQELSVETFVPNDSYLTNEKCIAVISGHNGSGKSVYLKQVGIIVYLAHIGSFVPCEKAAIGLTSRIFTRISSEESVSDPHSAFSLDLNQMSRMLNHYEPRSLCLIDEFGKGTSPVDGMSLLAAVVKFFAKNSILTMFALHFTEIFESSLFPQEIHHRINCFRMDALSEAHNEEVNIDVVKLIPLYKLKYGLCKSSYGIACARDMGVNEKTLLRAQEIKSSIRNKIPLAPLQSLFPTAKLSSDERQLLTRIIHNSHDKID